MRSAFLATTLLVLFSLPAHAQSDNQPQAQGRIMGTVTNDQGEPIAEAAVCTAIGDSYSSRTACGDTHTDKNGKFELDHLPMGEVGVFAEKQQDGYLTDRNMLKLKRLRLTPEEPLARVVLNIGPKPAELKLTVDDKTTHKPMDAFFVRWITVDGNRAATWVKSGITLAQSTLIPSDTDVILEVSARGYEMCSTLIPRSRRSRFSDSRQARRKS